MKKLIFVLLISIFCISLANAEYPKLTPYVSDFANLLTQEQENNLNILVTEIEKNTSVEIAIVTVTSTNGEDRVMYASHLGEENGVGKKDKDNGIVILWSVDNEKGGAIATGRGIESVLNDAKVARIGRQYRPILDEGKYYEAFMNITNDLNKYLQVQEEVTIPPTDDKSNYDWLIIVVVGIFIFIIFFRKSKSYSNSSNDEECITSKKRCKYKKFGNDEDSDNDYSTIATVATASVLGSSAGDDDDDDDDNSYSSSSSSSSGSFDGGSFGGGGGRF